MSNTIDKRIVEMQFDNRQFEKDVAQSLNTLERLRGALDFKRAANSFKHIKTSDMGGALEGIASGVSAITDRFSALGVMGATVIGRLTNATIDMTHKLANALVMDPIKMGFSEYETQINAIQTIKANTGADVPTINAYLDELNEYADKTIYNFTEMTRNIGTFTAAGVDLDKSVSAIKGIANLAAVSGSNSQQASTAMYQLSQALASGRVSLQDWNSVVNAGMGGKLFQNALQRTARVMGNLSGEAKEAFDQLQAGTLSFRESLTYGWLTEDVLTSTLEQLTGDMSEIELMAKGFSKEEAQEIVELGKMANAAATEVKTFTQLIDTLKEAMQSGWTQSWEIIIGDFEEAKNLMTMISDFLGEMINENAKQRNDMLAAWDVLGGRDHLIDGFKNLAAAVVSVTDVIDAAFKRFFPPKTGKEIADMTETFRTLTERIREICTDSENLYRVSVIFKTIAWAFSSVRDIAVGVGKALLDVAGKAGNIGSGFFHIAAELSEFAMAVKNGFVEFDPFAGLMERVTTIVTTCKEEFAKLKGMISGLFPKKETKKAKELVETIGEVPKGLSVIERFTGMMNRIGEKIRAFLDTIPPAIKSVSEFAQALITSAKSDKAFMAFANTIRATFTKIKTTAKSFADEVKKAFNVLFSKEEGGEKPEGSMVERLKARFGEAKTILGEWFTVFKTSAQGGYEAFRDFIVDLFKSKFPQLFKDAGEWTAGVMDYLSQVDLVKVFSTIGKILWGIKLAKFAGNIVSMSSSMAGLGKTLGKTLTKVGDGIKKIAKDGVTFTHENKDSLGTTMLKMAASIGVLVGSLYVLSKMDVGGISRALTFLGILAIEMTIFAAAFRLIGGQGATAFKDMGIAVGLLTIPIYILGKMDTGAAIKGITGVGVVMAIMAGFMALTRGGGFAKDSKTCFLSMAALIGVMAISIKAIGSMSAGDTAKGLIGITVLMSALKGFMKKSASFGKVTGLIGMAVSLGIIVSVMKSIARMDFSGIIKGLAAVGAVLTMITVMGKGMSGGDFAKSVMMMATIAGTMFIFLETFKRIKDINSESIVAFSASLSAILLALTGSIKLLEGINLGSAVIGIVKIALIMLTIAGIMAGVGALVDYIGKDGGGAIISAIGVFGDIMEAVSTAFGQFIGGIGVGLSKSMVDIGSNLSDFMKNLDSFLKGIKEVDSDVLDGALSLTGALLAITGAEVIQGLVNLFGGGNSMDTFVGGIKTLATGLKTFATEMSGFKEAKDTDLSAAIKMAESLVAINNALPKEGGLASLMGVPDLSEFSNNIPGFADGLKAFAENITGFTETSKDDIDKSIKLAEALVKLNNALPKEGGLASLMGVPNLSGFSNNIPGFADGLKAYAENIKDFSQASQTDIDNSIKLAKALVDLNNALPLEGGWFERIAGIPDLSGFSDKLPILAGALTTYANTIPTLGTAKKEDVDNSITIIDALIALNDKLPATGGLLQGMMGTKDLGTFADNVSAIGGALSAFSSNVVGIQVPQTENAMTALDLIKQFSENLELEQGFFDWLTGQDDVTRFTSQLESLATGIGKFATQAQEIDVKSASKVVTLFDSIADMIAGAKGVSYEDAFSIIGFFDLFTAQQRDLGQLEESANTLVEGFVTPLHNGLNSGMSNAAITAMNATIKTFNSYMSTMRVIGGNMAIGLANGMRYNARYVSNAASYLASLTVTRTRAGLDEHSPSRIAFELGRYWDLGLANGMVQYAGLVEKSAGNVSSAAIETTKDLIATLHAATIENMDVTPAIRPVLDMSDMMTGIGMMNGMLGRSGMSVGLGRGMTFSRHAGSMGQRAQTPENNRDVVSAIHTLTERFDNLSAAVNNMQLVLDSGTLVGKIGKKMDRQLGVLAARKERGN